MTTTAFNAPLFRTQFPEFRDTAAYPDAVLSSWWTLGAAYISDQNANTCYWKQDQAQLANDLACAHITRLNAMIAAGQNPGTVQGATEGSVSVQFVPPKIKNGFTFWLNQTPYGQQLLALLNVAAGVGMLVGGLPEPTAFRKWGGLF